MKAAPLADRIRPPELKDFIGQTHLVGIGKPIRLMVQNKTPFSLIFWGPPGCGKTTLALIIAKELKLDFFSLSAVSASKKDLKKITDSNKNGFYPKGSIVFLDEIHRFNKAQQDYLLPFVEKGLITLIGATTENPSFTVIGSLLSRLQVFILKPLTNQEMEAILTKGLSFLKKEKGFSSLAIEPKAKKFLFNLSAGDARVILNVIESVVNLIYLKSGHPLNRLKIEISFKDLKTVWQKRALLYDRAGEEHYHTVSAFIKSMRASDIDASLYYLARMVEAGEDPLFIARRMVIFASEDIGMALPTALVVANEVFRACQTIGYPECAINLAHGAVYLAKAPKDRSAYNAFRSAQADVKKYGSLPIPLPLKNPVTKLMQKAGYGKGYEMYPNTNKDNKDKSLLPGKLKGKKYYSSNG